MGPSKGWQPGIVFALWIGMVAVWEGRQERNGFWHLLPAACMGTQLERALAVVAGANCSIEVRQRAAYAFFCIRRC